MDFPCKRLRPKRQLYQPGIVSNSTILICLGKRISSPAAVSAVGVAGSSAHFVGTLKFCYYWFPLSNSFFTCPRFSVPLGRFDFPLSFRSTCCPRRVSVAILDMFNWKLDCFRDWTGFKSNQDQCCYLRTLRRSASSRNFITQCRKKPNFLLRNVWIEVRVR